MTLGKTPLKSGRRKQPRILAQFPVEIRFKADGANFQIVQGVTSNLSEEGASCRLRQPIPADSVDPEEFWLHSNFITIKKTTVENFVNGYGKSAMVDLTIPRKLVERLNTTPEQIENDIFSGRCYVRLKRITASYGERNERHSDCL